MHASTNVFTGPKDYSKQTEGECESTLHPNNKIPYIRHIKDINKKVGVEFQ